MRMNYVKKKWGKKLFLRQKKEKNYIRIYTHTPHFAGKTQNGH